MEIMKTNQIFSKVLSIVCLIGLLAACTTAPAPEAVATTVPEAVATTAPETSQPAACEIKMGLLLSLTGDLGDLGKAQLRAE